MVEDVLGLKAEGSDNSDMINKLMETIILLRQEAKLKKDYETSDKIRNELTKINISLKDTKEGTEWKLES